MSKCVISLDLPEDIVVPLRDQYALQTWSGKGCHAGGNAAKLAF